jgi:hypothetical protein
MSERTTFFIISIPNLKTSKEIDETLDRFAWIESTGEGGGLPGGERKSWVSSLCEGQRLPKHVMPHSGHPMSEAKSSITEQSVRKEPGKCGSTFTRYFQKAVKPVPSLKINLLVTFKPREQLLEDMVLLADPADELLEFPIDVQG